MDGTEFLHNEREKALWKSLVESSWRYYAWVGLLVAVILWGAFAYLLQLTEGLAVTGLRDQISWGLYIVNFVFFIGISHAGTLISSILRLCNAGWRQPVTRLAEAITVSSLFIGGLMPVIDMGRPGRMANIIRYGRIQSNLVWDLISITTYLAGSILFLWLLMIPDIALLRDRYPNQGKFRARLYRALALGYGRTERQHEHLERANRAMTIIILPLAVSVHTVVAWIFAMSLRPGWQSSVFGPYFVVGAIFSGIAASIVAMYAFRRIYHLEAYLKPLHFRNLGYLLLTLTLTYLYFTINEYLTVGYKMAEHERKLVEMLFTGSYAWLFWGAQAVGVFIPFVILGLVLGVKPLRERFAVSGTVFASVLVIVGAWAKRYLIVVPTLSNPFLPAQGFPPEWLHYRPTWVEWSITAAAFAGFLLIYTLLSKLFPIVSIWETREASDGHAEKAEAATPALTCASAKRIGGASLIVIALILAGGASAEAKKLAAAPRPTALTLSSERMSEAGRNAVRLAAVLTGENGAPLADMPVRFELKTLFGTLKLGSFPTNESGEAVVMLRDKRLGVYTLRAAFEGDGELYGASEAVAKVDFGPLPPPSLPPEGVLIAPRSTFLAAFPFLLFYGACWLVFLYAFGWCVLWKMRKE